MCLYITLRRLRSCPAPCLPASCCMAVVFCVTCCWSTCKPGALSLWGGGGRTDFGEDVTATTTQGKGAGVRGWCGEKQILAEECLLEGLFPSCWWPCSCVQGTMLMLNCSRAWLQPCQLIRPHDWTPFPCIFSVGRDLECRFRDSLFVLHRHRIRISVGGRRMDARTPSQQKESSHSSSISFLAQNTPAVPSGPIPQPNFTASSRGHTQCAKCSCCVCFAALLTSI